MEPKTDRMTLIGIVLIAAIFLLWSYFNRSMSVPIEPQSSASIQDSLTVYPNVVPKHDSLLVQVDTVHPRLILVETPLYRTALSTDGARFTQWKLRHFLEDDGSIVDLIHSDDDSNLQFFLPQISGDTLSTSSIQWSTDAPDQIQLTGTDSSRLLLRATLADGSALSLTYVFYADRYSFRYVVDGFDLKGRSSRAGHLVWKNGIRFSEPDISSENSHADALAFVNGDLVDLDAKSDERLVGDTLATAPMWIATRTKYFASLIHAPSSQVLGAILNGRHRSAVSASPDSSLKSEVYDLTYLTSSSNHVEALVYLGPLDHDVLRSYDMGFERTTNLGWKWVIRPIAEYLILPSFKFLHRFIANYGLVIIVFSILLKLLLYPLSRSSFRSMKKMQSVQPRLKELQVKFKDDQTRLQQETMQLYREAGVNPLGGCLPQVAQMPILYALYAVFANTIELRGAGFFAWITDLSRPDSIMHLPFKLPLYGDHISLLALLMGGTMIVQQKFTPVSTTAQQPAFMMYVFPVFLLLIFNSLPSGLNLYYFVFNLLSIAQQWWINRSSGDAA